MPPKKQRTNGTEENHVRYAVVGLGYIAQAAVLPAFKNAKKNSRLAALVSDDPEKLKKLSKRYKVEHTATAPTTRSSLTGGRSRSCCGT